MKVALIVLPFLWTAIFGMPVLLDFGQTGHGSNEKSDYYPSDHKFQDEIQAQTRKKNEPGIENEEEILEFRREGDESIYEKTLFAELDKQLADGEELSKILETVEWQNQVNTSKGEKIFEADIILTPEQEAVLLNETTNYKRAARKIGSFDPRWPNQTLYYIDSRVFTGHEEEGVRAKEALNEAIDEFQKKTCIKIKEGKMSTGHYVEIVDDGGCYSHIGYIRKSGQKLGLGSGCHNKGTVVHELMHALGFWHEHTRPDRDQYVQINFGNITSGSINYEKHPGNEVQDTKSVYDYESVMHYSGYALTDNWAFVRTIVARISPNSTTLDYDRPLGQNYGLSKSDAEELNSYYGCPECEIYTNNDHCCYFPFTYEEVEYDQCTPVDNAGTPWCYTTTNYEGDPITWGNCKAYPVCIKADWSTSFENEGWSKCPTEYPYMTGLERSLASSPTEDFIYHIEGAQCCKAIGDYASEDYVTTDWIIYPLRGRTVNLCPPGYFLGGLHRGSDNHISSIDEAHCRKPKEAPSADTDCWDVDFWDLNYDHEGMVWFNEAGYYITGVYRSTCEFVHCIELFRFCKMV